MNPMDIFNMDVKDINLFNEDKKESVLYNPKADQGKDGVYRALIRFVPNIKNPNKPIERKFVYWLEDADGNSAYYDSPTTVSEKCPVQDMFFKLRNSESAIDKKNAEKLKRREIFYSVIQVIKDPQDEKQEGKLRIFKYGWKIKQKIDEEMKPQFDEPTQIFDPFEGKNFELTITKQGGFNNYDSSKFQGRKSPMLIDGEMVKDDQNGRMKVIEYLKDSPDLSVFEYKPWDDETRAKIYSILELYKSPGKAIGSITGKANMSYEDIDLPTSSNVPSANVDFSEVDETSEQNDLKGFLADLDLA